MHPAPLYRRVLRALRLLPYDLLWGKRAGRVSLGPRLTFDPQMDLMLERGVILSHDGSFSGPGRVHIGARTYLGPYFSIQCITQLTIGADCLFGNFVSIVDNDHERRADTLIRLQPLHGSPVTIGDDCWLGEKSIILRGVTIGDHAIVAAGAVVRTDIEPYAIVAGVPARVVGKRACR